VQVDDDGDPVFLWEVGAELIDLDRWAQSSVDLRVQAKSKAQSNVTRFGFWPVAGLVIVIAALSSGWVIAVGLAVWIALVFLGARLWNHGAARRLAKRLHAVPAASEPFTFRADAEGTHGQSESGSSELRWSRYTAVQRHDELVVLTQDADSMLFLPAAGLLSGQAASTAVTTISSWIEAARPEGPH
jgi:hypothetical protein